MRRISRAAKVAVVSMTVFMLSVNTANACRLFGLFHARQHVVCGPPVMEECCASEVVVSSVVHVGPVGGEIISDSCCPTDVVYGSEVIIDSGAPSMVEAPGHHEAPVEPSPADVAPKDNGFAPVAEDKPPVPEESPTPAIPAEDDAGLFGNEPTPLDDAAPPPIDPLADPAPMEVTPPADGGGLFDEPSVDNDAGGLFESAPAAPAGNDAGGLFEDTPPPAGDDAGGLFDDAPAPAGNDAGGLFEDAPAPAGDDAGGLFDDAPAPAGDDAGGLFGDPPADAGNDAGGLFEDPPAEQNGADDAGIFGKQDSRRGMRLWTDNTGRYHTVGRLVVIAKTHIRLFKANDRYATVPLTRLSSVDLEYVLAVAKKLNNQATQIARR